MKKACGVILSVVLLAVVLYVSKGVAKNNAKLNASAADESASAEGSLVEKVWETKVPKIEFECERLSARECKEDFVWTWDAIEGADGYEVGVKTKKFEDDDYGEFEYFESDKNSYVLHDDEHDEDVWYMVQVRPFRGEGDKREYGKWSNYSGGRYLEFRTEYSTYEEVLETIAKGRKYGFDGRVFDYREIGFLTDYADSGYCFKDLDGDGTEEMIFGRNTDLNLDGPIEEYTVVNGVYSIKNGEVIKTIDGNFKGECWIAKNGAVVKEGPADASCYFYEFMDYVTGETIDKLYKYYGGDYYSLDYEGNEKISEEEVDKFFAKYARERFEITPFVSQ